jgi:hypothetical protein
MRFPGGALKVVRQNRRSAGIPLLVKSRNSIPFGRAELAHQKLVQPPNLIRDANVEPFQKGPA